MFTVITTMETKLVEPSSITTKKDGITASIENITIKKKISSEDELAASGGTTTVDITGFAPIKGIAIKSSSPLTIQLVGGANPGMNNVTDIHMRGEFTSLILTNNGTEAATVEWLVYGDPS